LHRNYPIMDVIDNDEFPYTPFSALLLGSSGCGKTWAAVKWAAEIQSQFERVIIVYGGAYQDIYDLLDRDKTTVINGFDENAFATREP
jgi:hypothetical protein